MTEQLIDEIAPWVITAALLFGLFHSARALMRKQEAARLIRAKMGHKVADHNGLPAQSAQAESGRVRVKQRVRLRPSSSARSRPKQPF